MTRTAPIAGFEPRNTFEALVWKELGERLVLFGAIVVLLALSWALAYSLYPNTESQLAWQRYHELPVAMAPLYVLTVVQVMLVLLIPASLFASERRRGTLPALLALPISRGRLLAAKLLAGLILVVAVDALYLGLVLSLPGWFEGTPVSLGVVAHTLSLIGAAEQSLSFCVAALVGLYTGRVMVSALCGALAPIAGATLSLSLAGIITVDPLGQWAFDTLLPAAFAGLALAALALAFRRVRRLEPST